MTSPTQRSLALLRKHGYTAQVVEHWNPHAFIRQDLYGFGDILAFDPLAPEILIVQTTAGSCAAARRDKIEASPHAIPWMHAGGHIVVHGWAKRGARGKRKIWTCVSWVMRLRQGGGIEWTDCENAGTQEAGP